MAKEIRGDDERSTSFKDYVLLPSYTDKNCIIQNINIETELSPLIKLKFPFIPAAMRSVTGYKMALEVARNGMIPFLPRSLELEEIIRIIKDIKAKKDKLIIHNYPGIITAGPEDKFERVYEEKIKKYGHSTIPIVNEYGKYLGVFYYISPEKHPNDAKMKDLMKKNKNRENIDFCLITATEDKILEYMEKNGKKIMPILDNEGHLIKFAFKKDRPNYIAVSIDTYEGWKKRVDVAIEAGVDLISIDTSDAYNYWAVNVIKEFKKEYPNVPICGGNIVTKEGFDCLVSHGADIIKVGMGIGSICTTTEVKRVGRGGARSLIEVVNKRDEYFNKTGKYIPVIMDGSIENTGDMVIALAIGADALMMGKYFNQFFEAEGTPLDAEKKPIDKPDERENEIKYKEIWGEGSRRAMNLGRYSHETIKTFFPEGVEGIVKYRGRLKPNIEYDANIVKSSMSNAGCRNLKEFRENAILERLSEHGSRETSFYGIETTNTIER
ncbi:MAG: IMP dehydrogenase [Candidatus Aenigmatarchaeota archaeon]